DAAPPWAPRPAPLSPPPRQEGSGGGSRAGHRRGLDGPGGGAGRGRAGGDQPQPDGRGGAGPRGPGGGGGGGGGGGRHAPTRWSGRCWSATAGLWGRGSTRRPGGPMPRWWRW